MGKFAAFGLLWWLTGNPLLAIIILLAVFYFIDRRFVGLFPSLTRPFKVRGRLRRIRQELGLNPHYTSLKAEAAKLLIGLGKYKEAAHYLNEIMPYMEDSADVWYESGLCKLKLGQLEEGEAMIARALEMNPRTAYGEPYLRLGEALAQRDPGKALRYLEQFGEMQSSSCEAYYRLGQILQGMGRGEDAKRAFGEAVSVYRSLPRYKRKSERRWALMSWFRK